MYNIDRYVVFYVCIYYMNVKTFVTGKVGTHSPSDLYIAMVVFPNFSLIANPHNSRNLFLSVRFDILFPLNVGK